MRIIILKNYQEHGPFSYKDVQNQLQAGQITLEEQARLENSTSTMPLRVLIDKMFAPRRQGLKLMIYGGAVMAALLAATWILPHYGWQLGLTSGLPGVFFFMGLLEVITNRPFLYWAKKWDNMSGWKKAALGTSMAVLFFAGSLFVLTLVVMWFYK